VRCWVCWVVLLGCGDNLTPPPESRSGTRLKLQRFELAPETHVLAPAELGYFDRERGELCWPLQLADGRTYCAPVAPADPPPRTIFTSNACTDQIVASREPTSYAIEEVWLAYRSIAAHVRRVGPAVVAPTERFELRDGVCLGPFPLEAGLTFFAALDPVPRAELAVLATSQHQLASGLAVVRYRGADGFQANGTLIDRATGVPCQLEPAADDDQAYACTPVASGEVRLFHDATCTEPVLAIEPGAEVPETAVVFDPQGCATHFRVSLRTGGPVYRRNGTGCTRTFLPASSRQYLLIDPVTPPVVIWRHEAGARYAAITLGDLLLETDELYDHDLATPCRIDPKDPLGVRCVPRHAVSPLLHGERPCTGPLLAEVRQACSPRARFARTGSDRFHEVFEPVASTQLFRGDIHDCFAYAPQPGHARHAIGAPFGPQAFEPAQLVIED
jgi:hypothetical protein